MHLLFSFLPHNEMYTTKTTIVAIKYTLEKVAAVSFDI